MATLAEWLRAHGLEQYERALADNDVDFDVLADLTDHDLEELGLSLGHRRKLQREIAAMRSNSAPLESGTAARRTSWTAQDAERRQVTVMFCDLVGSTALANQLDPEDMGVLIRGFRDACASGIARFDGYVAKFMGDGVLAYFGYPEANEDAPEHAVHSALSIVDSIRQLKRPDGRDLQARIGIATGTVVIGDLIGEGLAREHSVVGDTPNLAARLQALANPNAILIGHNTYHLLGKRFDYEDLGDRTLKGFARPVRVWRVLRDAAAETRFAATRAGAGSSFVGRDKELTRLLEMSRLAAQGEGQCMLVLGEAGIGKSRLVDRLLERIDDDGWRRVTCQCSPYHINSALHPVIRHLERAAGFAVEDADEVKLGKLERMLEETNEGPTVTNLVAGLLALPVDRYPALDLTPVQRKAATIAGLVDIIKRLAEKTPLLLLLEDAHWIDPTTRELWTRLADAIAESPMLAVITARPEFVSPWARARVQVLELTRLTAGESTELIARIAAPRLLEPEVADDIVAKADGIPLFVEELTKSVLESPLERPVVPATLQDSLMARLDRLGPAREIAQVAAVIGQQFSQALLADVIFYSAEELATGIQHLVDAGLVFRQSRAAELSYSFKHALLRDVAYENLLRARRQQLHERVARAIVQNFPALAESEPELPAHHFAQAGEFDLACAYRERAGDRAVARSSFTEAVAQFNGGLAAAAKLEAGPQRTRRELDLLLKSGPPMAIIKGGHSTEVGNLYERARECATTLGGEIDLFTATWGLWFHTITGRRLDLAHRHAESLVTLAMRNKNDDLTLEGFHCRWSTAMFRGDVATGLESSQEGIRRYDRKKHSWLGPVYGGHDPGVCAYAVRQIVLGLVGRRVEARQHGTDGIRLAEELRHLNSLVHALINGLVPAVLSGDCLTVTRDTQRLLDLAEKHNLPPPRAHALFLSGWAQASNGDASEGLAVMEAQYPRASAMGPFFRYYAALLAEERERAGRFDAALTLLRSAIATITEPGVGFAISELYRLQGTCLLHIGASQADEAMRSLRTAVAIARQQGATLLELRAAMSLVRAGAASADPAKDMNALRTLCARLPGTFESPELHAAKELLAG